MIKIFYTLIFSVIISSVIHAQQSTFTKVIWDADPSGIQGYALVPAPGNGFVIAGSQDYGYGGGFLLRLDTEANITWNHTFAGISSFHSIISTGDSSYIAAGTDNNDNAVCLKFNDLGDTLWLKVIRASGYILMPTHIEQTNDSGCIIAGTAYQSNTNSFIAKLDAEGNLQWLKIFSAGQNDLYLYTIRQLPDSSYILSGVYGNSDFQACLVHLSPEGIILWSKLYIPPGGNIYMGVSDVQVTASGFVCNLYHPQSRSTLMATDFSGNVLWAKRYDVFGPGFNFNMYYTPTLHKTSDGGFIVIQPGAYKTDSSGNVVWSDDLFLYPADAIETRDKGCLVLGNGPLIGVRAAQPYSPQIGLIKMDSLGNANQCVNSFNAVVTSDTLYTASVTFSSLNTGSISGFSSPVNSLILYSDSGCVAFVGGVKSISYDNLIQVTPNPVKDQLRISSVDKTEAIIDIYDMLGNNIYSGIYSGTEKFIGINFATGIYIIKFTSSFSTVTKKFIKQ